MNPPKVPNRLKENTNNWQKSLKRLKYLAKPPIEVEE
jgi:hypothetical protein